MGEEEYDDVGGEMVDDMDERKPKRTRTMHESRQQEVDDFSDGFRERDETTVHVRPIPSGMTKSQLASELGVYGEVAHVQIVCGRRFAFVHFADSNDAMALKEMGSVLLGDQEVQINAPLPPGTTNDKPPIERKDQAKRISKSDGYMEHSEATVRISPVPQAMQSKADISAEFEIYGEVAHVHIKADRTSAFVHYVDVDSALALREKRVIDIDGEEVNVQAANTPANPSIHFEKKKQIDHQLEVVQRFHDDSSDPHAHVLSFFNSDLAQNAADFVSSLNSDEASKVMELLATFTERKDWRAIQRVHIILESEDLAQVESMDLDSVASTATFDSSEKSTVELIAKYLKHIGGAGDIGVIGSKFRIKKPDLERWGFMMTPQGKSGQYKVTAPHDLVDIKVSAKDIARFPAVDENRSRIRRGKRGRGDIDENTTRASPVSRTQLRMTARSQDWGARMWTGQDRRGTARGVFGAPPLPPPLPPPRPRAPVQTRYPAPAAARAPPRPSMAPHIAAKSMSHTETQLRGHQGQRRAPEDGRPNPRKGPPGQRRPFSAF